MDKAGNLLVRGGRVFQEGDLPLRDLRIRAGRIVELGSGLKAAADEESLDLDGLVVLPGMLDSQVHFREPGLTHKEDLGSGSRAAIAGGVTSYMEMPNTRPATVDAASLADKIERARASSWADFAFFMGATADNARELGQLERLPGCAGVKIFMGSSTGSLLVDDAEDLRTVLAHGTRRVAVHAEDNARLLELKALHGKQADHPRWHTRLRDPECARLAVERLVETALACGRPVHVLHTNSREEMELLERWRGNPLVTVETTPQHLLMTAPGCYEELGSHAQMNPPVREAEHGKALWAALRSGLITVIGSDHAPHTLEEKARDYPECPSGMPGVETVLPVLLDQVSHGRLGLDDLVRLYSEGPARIYGVLGKGRLARGFDGDLAIVDPDERWAVRAEHLQSRAGWTPWEGRELCGRVKATVLRGNLVWREGVFLGSPQGQPLRYL
ncbi:MAG: dihydroorotase [Calditrichaeota bacterium]|nr:dihydroorotase [Calditrichota bacterium]